MRYNNEGKFQYEYYSSIEELLEDAYETAGFEDNYDNCVQILTDKETTEYLLREMSDKNVNQECYDVRYVDITDENNLFVTSLFSDGEVYIDKATDNYGKCVDLDGILFVDEQVDKQFYCDTYRDAIVFNF